MYGTCGDRKKCNDGGIDNAHKVWEELLVPYYDSARRLTSLEAPEGGRKRHWIEVGGCPLCVMDDREGLSNRLVESVCCHDHGPEIGKWIKDHMRSKSGGRSHLCRKHMQGADEAWILVRSENYVDVGPSSVNIGHVAFAFKRVPSPHSIWPEEAVWICGSSDGVADIDSKMGAIYGRASYWWNAENHPLDESHFKDGGYDYAKVVKPLNGLGAWVEALVATDDEKGDAYVLVTNNCADVVWRVLNQYGVLLPPLGMSGLAPMSALEWWHTCPGEILNLSRERAHRR